MGQKDNHHMTDDQIREIRKMLPKGSGFVLLVTNEHGTAVYSNFDGPGCRTEKASRFLKQVVEQMAIPGQVDDESDIPMSDPKLN